MLTARTRRIALVGVSLTLLLPVAAEGSLIICGAHTDHSLVPGASLTDVRLQVDLTVIGGVATFDFTNVSVAPELSASFKLIVLDLVDDDTGNVILSNGKAQRASPEGAFLLFPFRCSW